MANRDNRFGRFKFGTSHKFGASSFDMPALAWDISIDWDGDGIFEVNESNLMTAIHIKRGRTRLLKSQGVGLENIPTGTASITLRNRDGRFDGWNQDSPLYPNVGAKGRAHPSTSAGWLDRVPVVLRTDLKRQSVGSK